MKSSVDRYGTVAILIHWTSALLIIGLLISGFRATAALDAATKAGFLRFHVPMGLFILALTVFRILWWQFADRKPASLPGDRLQTATANIVHLLFYVVIIGMVASGIGMLALSGAGSAIFSPGMTVLPDFTTYAPRIPHGIAARALVALLALHVGGALYHHFIKNDRIFARMGLGR